jgi:metal-responsive CopG/Arc/MetJ family transcriptional regulator
MGNRNGRQPIRGETKERVNMTLTPTCQQGLDIIAATLGFPSRSEAVEELVKAKLAELQASESTAA